MDSKEVVIFWFRRDLRLNDNRGLHRALSSGYRVLPLFIYDREILLRLEPDDARVSFICDRVAALHAEIKEAGGELLIRFATAERVFMELPSHYNIKAVYTNRDYEPYAIKRDAKVEGVLKSKGISFITSPDQLVFEPGEVLKKDGKPYTVYTPFSRRWLELFNSGMVSEEPSVQLLGNLYRSDDGSLPPEPHQIGFTRSVMTVRPFDLGHETISNYAARRDFPDMEGTTALGPHLRFGTISIRDVFRRTEGISSTFTGELIWREFFMHILSHFPHVAGRSFRPEFEKIEWLNDEEDFDRWCRGVTGYPLVDAGMRELLATGTMHNRVRMVTAGFLTKHLLCDWQWGEAWFASRLLDFELASNNGNWQWAAGTGCDAAPYFRIFNPVTQQKRFDPRLEYIKKWVPEYGTDEYPVAIVGHTMARERALRVYTNRR
jgi:deoxyribodipyrimidine photo-lyase